jgi:hypothetical protein
LNAIGLPNLVATGAALGIAAYALLAVVGWTPVAFMVTTAVMGFVWGLVLTGLYPVVICGASVDKTSVAVAVNLVVRNTALAVGVQFAFAIIENAGVAGHLPAESGFTRVFLVGLIGACVTLVASWIMPGRATTGHGRAA